MIGSPHTPVGPGTAAARRGRRPVAIAFGAMLAALAGAQAFAGTRAPAGTGKPAIAAEPAAAAAPAAALPSGKVAWIRAESANFTLFSGAGLGRTQEIGRKFERLRVALARIYPRMDAGAPVPTHVYVFKDDSAFRPYRLRFEGREVELAGYFSVGPEANYVALNGSRDADPWSTIGHEYIHYFLEHNLPPLPTWFDEGLAECYSTFRATDTTAEIGRPDPARLHHLRSTGLLPIRELFAIHRESRDYHEGDRRSSFYSTSWALTHYLMWGTAERRAALARYLDALGRNEAPEEAFVGAFKMDYERLDLELKRYVSQRRFSYSVIRAEELKIDSGVRAQPLSRADLLFRLGDLLAHQATDRAPEAEAHFNEALRIDPAHAPAMAGIGFLRQRAGKADEAAAFYEKALALAPADALIAFRMGDLIVSRINDAARAGGARDEGSATERARARDLLGRCMAARPSFAEAFAVFGLSYAAGGDPPGPGIAALRTALRLLPNRADIASNLAILYARNGELDRARAVVDGVLVRLDDPGATALARQAIARMEARAHALEEAAPADDGAAAAGGASATRAGDDAASARLREEMIANLEKALAEATDPDLRKRLEATLRWAKRPHDPDDTAESYNRHVELYNRAVALANGRAYKEAIALLEKTIPEIRDPDLLRQTKDFLARLKKDAARLQSPPR